MRRAMRLEVQAHPRGPWLVRAGGRALAVPPALGRALLPLHGAEIGSRRQVSGPSRGPAAAFDADTEAAVAAVAAWIAACGEPRVPVRRRPAVFGSWPWRVPLLPAVLVRRAAAVLAPLASWPCLAYVAAAGLTTALALKPWAQPCSLTTPALLLFAGGALWHELGHAAALKREGYAPGGIGAGLLVCVPVLYADVSAVGLLARGGRLRVDLAGLAFQAGAAGAFALAGAVPGPPAPVAAAARAAAVATLLALAWGLLPLPRSDGTWAMRDALETGTGDRGTGDGDAGDGGAGKAAPRLRAGLTVVRFALAGAACWVLPPRLVGILAWACARFGCPLAPGAGATVAGVLTALALAWWITRAACAIMRRGTHRPEGREGARPG